MRNCIRCHLEGSGRKVLGSVAIRSVSSSMFWKYSRRFLDMVPEGCCLGVFRSRIETVVPRPPPLTPSHRRFYFLDFCHSWLFSAFLGHLRACGQSRPNLLEGLPPAGHVAGFKTSFAFIYYHTPQSDIHKLQSTCSLKHTSHNSYWFATTPEVPPPHPERLGLCCRSVHTAATAPSKALLYILQHGSNISTSLITSSCTY